MFPLYRKVTVAFVFIAFTLFGQDKIHVNVPVVKISNICTTVHCVF